MFQPNPEDHLHLRLHRARSVVLTSDELVEIRAAQRTFEGAYMRTALGQFSFALIILKIFTSEFYAIGALFAVYGAAAPAKRFRTSGNSVALLAGLSLAAYSTLLVLTWQLVS
ncbi:Putative phosphomutase PMU1 [Verticillium dahliae VDG2]|nr:Putative phosphomutase PMU1 [Verticillium dahliae VDG2]